MTNLRKGTSVIKIAVDDVMLDHPSWLTTSDGRAHRAVRNGPATWAITCSSWEPTGRSVAFHRVARPGDAPKLDVVDPRDLTSADSIVGELCATGQVARLRNPDLWDALATSIIRQVIRAGQAHKLYRALCTEHGEPVVTDAGTSYLFPTPDTVLDLSDAEFARLGLAFKRQPLRAAAEAYRDFGVKWAELDPSQLLAEIQHVPRIGPWTAGATVADVTNDYSLYPFADLAVRTWAKRLASERAWPENESDFARVWQRLAGEQLSEWTLLTLAWGVRHAADTGAVAI